MNISPKVRFLNIFRNVFKIKPLEAALSRLTYRRSPDHVFSKFVPNPYQYSVGSIRAIERNGIRMKVDISDYVGHYIYFGFDSGEGDALFNLCKPGANVIDVGTNVGYTLLNLARIASNGTVIGFEPDPYNAEKCMANIAINGFKNISFFQLALSDSKASLEMEVRTITNRGGNRIVSKGGHHKVEAVCLDEFGPAAALPRVDLIKVDVEGHEMHVLRGARQILKNHKPTLFVEIDDKNLRDQGYSAKALLEFLTELGYSNFTSALTGARVKISDEFFDCHFDLIAN